MVPSECELLEGRTWQFTQASALDSAGAVAPWFTCARCTPATPVAVATAGGEAAWFTSAPATLTRPVVPWQDEQLWAAVRLMVPSMWVVSAPRVMLPVVAVSQV